MTFPRKILLFSPTVSQYVQSGNRFQRYYYIATERVEANRCPVCDEIKPCTKADASGRRQWWQLWREGDGRKEGCPSLCGNLQFQGYRAVPFAFSPSLPFSWPDQACFVECKSSKNGLTSFHELFYLNFSSSFSFSLSLSLCMYVCMYVSLPPPWVFCYLFFCLTFAYKDVRIVEVAARGWGSKEWFTLGPFFLFLWK